MIHEMFGITGERATKGGRHFEDNMWVVAVEVAGRIHP